MANRVISLLIVTGIVGVMAYVLIQAPNRPSERLDTNVYLAELQQERSEKDLFFKADPDSPLSEDQQDSFGQLAYYPVDPAFRIEARVDRLDASGYVELATSDGRRQQLQRWGYAKFSLNGNPQQLLLLKPSEGDKNQLFVPFTDATSARQTYGAGRYLDVPLPTGNVVVIDFNKAYNPYCAYNDKYSCPLPPPENMLGVPIQAGEKTYQPKPDSTR